MVRMGLVITSEEALMPSFYTDSILHRDSELKAINEAIKPLFEGRHPDNLFISGDSGTGKTACIKHVLKGLEGRSLRIKPIYVNCWQHSTRMAVYSIIARALDEMMPRRGLARDEVYDRIIEVMEKEGARVLLVLDDLDGLFFRNEQKLFYDLGRAGNGKPFFGVIGISNDAQLLESNDIGAKSAMRFVDMEFKHYTAGQMTGILAQRAKLGLSSGSWSTEIIEACAAGAVARKSNVAEGLNMLWAAAKKAEKAGRTRIKIEDVKVEGHMASAPVQVQTPSVHLSDEERLILDIVGRGPKSSTDLYLEFLMRQKRSKRQIRNYISGLEAKKLLHTETVKRASPMLTTRIIQLSNWMETRPEPVETRAKHAPPFAAVGRG